MSLDLLAIGIVTSGPMPNSRCGDLRSVSRIERDAEIVACELPLRVLRYADVAVITGSCLEVFVVWFKKSGAVIAGASALHDGWSDGILLKNRELVRLQVD
jgi:hypothetical protein